MGPSAGAGPVVLEKERAHGTAGRGAWTRASLTPSLAAVPWMVDEGLPLRATGAKGEAAVLALSPHAIKSDTLRVA